MNSNQHATAAGRLSIVVLAVTWALFLAVAPAQADLIGLGNAGNYNAFVFGQFTSKYSDTQGGIAAGGNVSLEGYGVGSGLDSSYAGSSLVVGGNLYYRNGQVKAGNVDVGGTADVNSSVGTPSGTVRDNVSNLPVSFNQTKQELSQLSQNLSQQAATGNTELKWSTTLSFTGDDSSDVQVFNVNGDYLSQATGFELNSIPADAYIIFNIVGEDVSMMNQGQWALSSYSNRVLFNFIDAKILNLSGISVQGSVLALNADVVGNNGNLEGTLIANSFSGNLEFHNNQFVALPGGDGGGAGTVPEPGTLLLLGPALGGAYLWNRRKKRALSAA